MLVSGIDHDDHGRGPHHEQFARRALTRPVLAVALAFTLLLSACSLPGSATRPPAGSPGSTVGTTPSPNPSSPSGPSGPQANLGGAHPAPKLVNASGNTVETRFSPPEGYTRKPAASDSFAHYLRNLPLKPDGTLVHYFDGGVKSRSGVYEAVIDIDVGTRDLQQCADAVMRLRSEYLYKHKRYAEISFNFANGFKADYATWSQGNRIVVEGNRARWVKTASQSLAYSEFRKYLDVVFAYANTSSLRKQMAQVRIADMQVGDVFVDQGHALIVIDMAENAAGKRLFMIAQSYMPAQDIQILQNPSNDRTSPWYELDFGDTLRTPEWTFTSEDLHRFR